MKKSDKLDIVCVDKALRYIHAIREAYNRYNITSAQELEDNTLCHLAITQIITNLYELKKKIQPSMLAKIPLFDTVRLKGARNIASHDYDNLDFDIIYQITSQLLRRNTIRELEAARDAVKRSHSGD